jgi:two-component system invasion response regulator UvrY
MINIAFIDDHNMILEGLKSLIGSNDKYTIVGAYTEFSDFFENLEKINPEIIILDYSMQGFNPVEGIKSLKAKSPDLKVIIYSLHDNYQYVLSTLKAGTDGFVTKAEDSGILLKAIEEVLAGKKYVSPSLNSEVLENINSFRKKGDGLSALSSRELQLFNLLAAGKGLSEIANFLNLSVSSVSTYRKRLLDKLGLKSNADIVRYSIENTDK